MKKIFAITIGIMLIAAACNKPAPVQPTPNPISSTYENQFMKVIIPNGWTATQVTGKPAAVNITKGNYILYINTQASQASGIEGGRFAEISMGAPSADAVNIEPPAPACGISESHAGTINNASHPRVDLFISAQDQHQYCAKSTNGATVWYFSYITDVAQDYFNYYTAGEGKGFVITMSYNSKTINQLPVKNSTELNSMLSEMTSIAQSLVIKQK